MSWHHRRPHLYAQCWQEVGVEARALLDEQHRQLARLSELMLGLSRIEPSHGALPDLEAAGRRLLAALHALVRDAEQRARRQSLEEDPPT